jgi:hypothetical protein
VVPLARIIEDGAVVNSAAGVVVTGTDPEVVPGDPPPPPQAMSATAIKNVIK